MRVLLYSESFLPSVGGVQTSIDLLARGLAEFDGHGGSADSGAIEVTVVTNTPAGAMDDSSLAYRVVRRPALWQLVRLIRETDVLHVAGPCFLPMTIAWLIRKPTMIRHHGYQAICLNGLLLKQPSQTVCPGHFAQRQYWKCVRCCSRSMGTLRSIRLLALAFPRRWLCKRVAANISITNHVAARLQLPRTRTIYHGIDVTELSNGEQRPESHSVLEFAYVGRLVTEKGLPLLLQAAKQMRSEGRAFKLTLIGDGPERPRLEELARDFKLGERVVFTGDLRGADLERAVGHVAVVVLPSICEETAGLSAIEHMMRGRLVIASDIGGLGEVVGDAGLKFTPGDWRGLAFCMQKATEDPALVAALGAAARARAVRFFRRGGMIANHATLFREAVHT